MRISSDAQFSDVHCMSISPPMGQTTSVRSLAMGMPLASPGLGVKNEQVQSWQDPKRAKMRKLSKIPVIRAMIICVSQGTSPRSWIGRKLYRSKVQMVK
jgi:hypothetical protein